MPPYERNSIQVADLMGREAIFASFMCEEDDTYDHLLLEDIHNVVINMTQINMVSEKSKNVTFSCEYDKDLDPINIKVSATLDEYKSSPALIEIQDFVDGLCHTIYNNLPFEEDERINNVKNEAINNLVNECFIDTGRMAFGRTYNIVGRIINNENEVVGIINNFNTSVDINNDFIMSLNDVISYIPLKDMRVSKIEFLTSKYAFIINDFEIVESNEGIARQYKINVKNCYAKPSSEPIIAETNTDIIDYDFFFDEREQLLSDRDKIFNSISNDDMSSLFDDLEF